MSCSTLRRHSYFFFFFFNDTATTEIYTLSLHDALPIFMLLYLDHAWEKFRAAGRMNSMDDLQAAVIEGAVQDRKSTRLNSSHSQISYAVYCLKKKNMIRSCDVARPTSGHRSAISACLSL